MASDQYEGVVNPNPECSLQDLSYTSLKLDYDPNIDITKLNTEIDGETYVSNYKYIPEKKRKSLNAKFFMVSLGPSNPTVQSVASMEKFAKTSAMPLVVRVVIQGNEQLVFDDETMEVHRLASVECERTKRRIETRRLVQSVEKNIVSMSFLSEFKEYLEACPISQKKIIFIPDPIHHFNSIRALENPGYFASTIDYDGRAVMSREQALLSTFQTVVVGINWARERCKPVSLFRQKLMWTMKKYDELKANMISEKYVNQKSEQMRRAALALFPVKRKDLEITSWAHEGFRYDTLVCKSRLDSYCMALGLSECFQVNDDKIPVWMLRMLVVFTTVEMFIPYNLETLKFGIIDGLLTKIPEEEREKWKKIMLDDMKKRTEIHKKSEESERKGSTERELKKESVEDSGLLDYSDHIFELNYNEGVLYFEQTRVSVGETQYFCNYCHLTSEKTQEDGTNYFIQSQRPGQPAESFLTQSQFSKSTNNPLVVRTFCDDYSVKRVFTSEILDVLTLTLEKQKMMNTANTERLKHYQTLWNTEEGLYSTIPLSEFKRLLKEFGVDETLVVIFPDLLHRFTIINATKGPNNYIETFSYNGKVVMSRSQAALHFFQIAIFKFRWDEEGCPKRTEALKALKSKFWEAIDFYKNLEKGIMIDHDFAKRRLLMLAHSPEHIAAKPLFKGVPDYLHESLKCDDIVSVDLFTETTSMLGNKEFLLLSGTDKKYSATLARVSYMLGTIRLFQRGKEDEERADFLLQGLKSKLSEKDQKVYCQNWKTGNIYYLLWGYKKRREIEKEKVSNGNKMNSEPTEQQNSAVATPEQMPSTSVETSSATSEVVGEQRPVEVENRNPESKEASTPSPPVNHNAPTNGTIDNQDNELVMVDAENSAPAEVPTPSPPVNHNAPTNDTTAITRAQLQNVVLVAEETRKAEKPKKSSKKPELVLAMKSAEELALEKAKKRNEQLENDVQMMREEIQKIQTKMENVNGILKTERTARKEAEQKAMQYESLAKTSESRGKRLNEREKELKLKNKDIEKLEKQLASQEQRLLKAEEIEKKGKERKKIEGDLRKSNKNLQLKNTALEQQVASLSENLEADREKHDTKQKKLTEEVAKLKSENMKLTSQYQGKEQEVTRLNSDYNKKYMSFLDINSRLKSFNNYLTESNDGLKEQVRKLNTWPSSRALMTPSPSTSGSETSANFTTSLRELRKIKDDFEQFERKQIMQDGEEMVVELLSLKNDAETREFAQIELNSLENSVEDYLEILNLNIQIFKKTANSSKVLSHSDLPKLSQKFMDLYDKLESQQSGIPDTDCVICFYFRHEHQETIACHRCPRIYHAACLRRWYQEAISCEKCPTCKVVLRDPEEYPELG